MVRPVCPVGVRWPRRVQVRMVAGVTPARVAAWLVVIPMVGIVAGCGGRSGQGPGVWVG